MHRGKKEKDSKLVSRILAMLLILSILISGYVSVQASSLVFPDVKKGSWAYEGVTWGVGEGIIKGLPNGTFAPNRTLTESEFLAMYVRFAGFDVSEPAGRRWADEYYKLAKTYNIQGLRGHNSMKDRNRSITRGDVAKVIASSKGLNLNVRQAVYFLYQNEISIGRTGNDLSFKSFGVDKHLTRAELPLFLYRIQESCAGRQLYYKDTKLPISPNKNRETFIKDKIKISDRTATDKEFEELALKLSGASQTENIVEDTDFKGLELNLDSDLVVDDNGDKVVKSRKLKDLGVEYFTENHVKLYERDGDMYIDINATSLNKDILENPESDFEILVGVYGRGGHGKYSILTYGGSDLTGVDSLKIVKGLNLTEGVEPKWSGGYDVVLTVAYKGKEVGGVSYLPGSVSMIYESESRELKVSDKLKDSISRNSTPFGYCSVIEYEEI